MENKWYIKKYGLSLGNFFIKLKKEGKLKKFKWRWYNMKARCENHNAEHYSYYGGRGIKCLLSLEEMKNLWDRDNAGNMEIPSLDRIDPNGNYDATNCRWIEMKENRKLARHYKFDFVEKIVEENKKLKRIIKQFDIPQSISAELFKN